MTNRQLEKIDDKQTPYKIQMINRLYKIDRYLEDKQTVQKRLIKTRLYRKDR